MSTDTCRDCGSHEDVQEFWEPKHASREVMPNSAPPDLYTSITLCRHCVLLRWNGADARALLRQELPRLFARDV